MKIERNEIKQIIKILKNIEYNPLEASTSHIVFPVSIEKTKDIDGLSLDFVNNKFGSEKMPEPAVMIRKTETSTAALVYCDFTYARKFDFVSFCELKNIKLSKKEQELMETLDCYLVNKENILIGFEI